MRAAEGLIVGVASLALWLGPGAGGAARAAEDVEKPRPEITAEAGAFAARLVPRGKSSRVLIRFEAEGGRLTEVAAVEPPEGLRPGAFDAKDFRSGLFEIRVEGLAPGQAAAVTLGSDFFTAATELWAVAGRGEPALVKVAAQSVARPDRVQALTLTLEDGGSLDGDGAADGAARLTVGPRDSFWGYALGTLFIRFFGIFIVLGVLQAGMHLSGALFQSLERRRVSRPPMGGPAPPAAPDEEEAGAGAAAVSPELAAALAVALHLSRGGGPTPPAAVGLRVEESSSWARQGRSQIMNDRLRVHARKP